MFNYDYPSKLESFIKSYGEDCLSKEDEKKYENLRKEFVNLLGQSFFSWD